MGGTKMSIDYTLKNYMEEYVSNVVNSVLQKEKIDIGEKGKLDIIAYVLNRVQPKYTVSQRGQIHIINNLKESLNERVNVVKLVFEALNIVLKRRNEDEDIDFSINFDHQLDYFVFPTLLGAVYDNQLNPLDGAKITLFINEKKADMITQNWQNPVVIKTASHGYYTFLPMPISGEGKSTFDLKILIEFNDKTKVINEKLTLKAENPTIAINSLNRVHKIGELIFE
jgi:competence protein ComFB